MAVTISGSGAATFPSVTSNSQILNGSSSGTVTIQAAAVAGTNTVTVPALTGTMITTASAGTALQVVTYQTGAYATTATTIPYDDTIPQNTEGGEFMTLAITPKSSTSKLLIDVFVMGTVSSAASSNAIAALFQDTTVNALAAGFQYSGYPTGFVAFRHIMTSGTTSSTTFKVRAGSSAGSFWFNGSIAGARLFGGVCASSITITEVAV